MSDLLVVPVTGEAIELNAPTDTLAQAIDHLKDLRQQINSVIDTVGEELTRRLDAENTRSIRGIGGWDIETKAPFTTEYDAERLIDALSKLVAADVIAMAVLERTVKAPPVKDWKVDRREINKLLKHPDPRVRDAVAGCGREVEQRRYVTVRRAA